MLNNTHSLQALALAKKTRILNESVGTIFMGKRFFKKAK